MRDPQCLITLCRVDEPVEGRATIPGVRLICDQREGLVTAALIPRDRDGAWIAIATPRNLNEQRKVGLIADGQTRVVARAGAGSKLRPCPVRIA